MYTIMRIDTVLFFSRFYFPYSGGKRQYPIITKSLLHHYTDAYDRLYGGPVTNVGFGYVLDFARCFGVYFYKNVMVLYTGCFYGKRVKLQTAFLHFNKVPMTVIGFSITRKIFQFLCFPVETVREKVVEKRFCFIL